MENQIDLNFNKYIEIKTSIWFSLFVFLIPLLFWFQLIFWEPETNGISKEWFSRISWIGGILTTIFLISFSGFGLKNLLNRNPLCTINSEGIWESKLGFINWKEIESFSNEIKYSRDGNKMKLIILLKNEKELKEITLEYVNKSFEIIRNVIEYYLLKNNIKDLGEMKIYRKWYE